MTDRRIPQVLRKLVDPVNSGPKLSRTIVQWKREVRASSPVHTVASLLLLVCGTITLLVTIGDYAWMSIEQRSLSAKYHAQSASTLNLATTADRGGITLLSIPKIDFQAAILEGTTAESLLLAPGHLRQTAWPGEPGNAAIAAHRDTFFHRLSELTPGDDIEIRRAGREYHYAVTGTMIVSPDDLSVTAPTKDNRLTLITCYPTYYIGPAPKRLVVVATLVPPQRQLAPHLAASIKP
jgi:sortase A